MKSINYILFVLALTFFTISCSSLDSNEGNVTLAIHETISAPFAVEVKSAAEQGITSEQIDAFTLWVDGTKISGTYADMKNETYKLKTGSYTAHAQNCTPEYAESSPDAYGMVRYYGCTEFEVETLMTTQNVEINCSIANSRVAVAISEDFSSYFETESTSVTISDTPDFSSRALQMITAGTQTVTDGLCTAYFTAGDAVYAEVTTRKKGADKSVTYKVKAVASTQSNTSYTVSLSVDEDTTSGGITFTVKGSEMTTNDFLSIQSYTPVTDFVEDK